MARMPHANRTMPSRTVITVPGFSPQRAAQNREEIMPKTNKYSSIL